MAAWSYIHTSRFAECWICASLEVMNKNAVILFGRYPREGFVKTRLAEAIGFKDATEFYRICLMGIFDEAEKLGDDYGVYFYYSDIADAEDVKHMVPSGFITMPQIDDVLPARIDKAFKEVFLRGYSRVAIFSTDVPELDLRLIESTLDAMDDCNVSIGPNPDGGYYCLGMNQYYPNILDVAYGDDVAGMYDQTVELAKLNRLIVGTIETVSDVDVIEDLAAYKSRNLAIWNKKYSEHLDVVI